MAEADGARALTMGALGGVASKAAVVQSWFACARTLAADRLTIWQSRAGDRRIEFFSTDRATARLAATRLWDADLNGEPAFRLGLLESEKLGWKPPLECRSARESLSLTHALGDHGIVAIIPVQQEGEPGFPWVVFDTTDGTGLVVVGSVADLPPWMVNAPFSLLLHLALASCGLRLLHAASLGLHGQGVLIAGPGGAGKSATTISGLSAGMVTVGDDYVVADLGAKPIVWPVYRTLKQSRPGLARFPDLNSRVSHLPTNWHGKVEFDAEVLRPGCIAERLTVRAIIIPRQTDGARTIVEPAPATAAFSALAPSTLGQLPGAGLAGFAGLTKLTRALPAFWFRLSQDPQEIGATLLSLMSDLAPQ